MSDDRFSPGTFVGDAAKTLADEANANGSRVDATFNGTQMLAVPGDTASQVHERWQYERILYQLKTGVIRVEDL